MAVAAFLRRHRCPLHGSHPGARVMGSTGTLFDLLATSSRRHPDRAAVVDPLGATASYAELSRQSARLREVLQRAGVRPGDRVGLCTGKSVAAIVSIFAILEAGAAYVPVDAGAPPSRNAFIFKDCSVRALIVEAQRVEALREAFADTVLDPVCALDMPHGYGSELVVVTPRDARVAQPPVPELAYILYTSGSTGLPKGVMHTHASALSFVDWASTEFRPGPQDRFSSHAPLHFDLSILDIYVAVQNGARIVLIGEELGKSPMRLAPVLAEHQLTVWYSTPSILRLLVEYGKLEQHDCSSLRLVLFAGEVFPIKYLRGVQAAWPHARYYNLYGPTETNVCTYYEAPCPLPADRSEPLPIGAPCSGDETMVIDASGRPVAAGSEGELVVQGGSVMAGYWNLPERDAEAFHVDDAGRRWYRTGDIVVEESAGSYVYRGRRDRMVKRRGYRVELGEIEAALYGHDGISEVAVVAVPDEESGVRIHAFLGTRAEPRPSLIALKGFASRHLPAYMVPDRFHLMPELPKTSTDKISYQQLKDMT